MSDQIFKFRNDLIEAYKGHYEGKLVGLPDGSYKGTSQFSEQELIEWVQWQIIEHSAKERLEIYLEWEGIIGFTNGIYDIAMGKFSA